MTEEEIRQRDKVVIGIIKNYEKISPYNKGRLTMLTEMLAEKHVEGIKSDETAKKKSSP